MTATGRSPLVPVLAAWLAFLCCATLVRAQTGACCAPDGTCAAGTAGACSFPNLFVSGVTCSATSCPPAGTCCTALGGCVVDFQTYCSAPNVWTAGRGCGPPNPCLPAVIDRRYNYPSLVCTTITTRRFGCCRVISASNSACPASGASDRGCTINFDCP